MPANDVPFTPALGPIPDRSFALVAHVLAQGHAASEAIRQEAESALAAHQRAAREYNRQLDQPDVHPFVSMPTGTVVRDLPNGERLFSLPDGTFLETTAQPHFLFVDALGVPHQLKELDGKVTVPDGRAFELKPEAHAGRDWDWIQGLPAGVEPVEVAEQRFRIVMPDGVRLDVFLTERRLVIINPTATLVILGQAIQGVGEKVQVQFAEMAGRAFTAVESKHRGYIDHSGDILLGLASGEDLVITFPAASPDSEETQRRYYHCEGQPV